MALDAATEVGGIIGSNIKATKQIQEDHVSAEVQNSLLLSPISRSKVETTVTITQYFYGDTAFILDHPVYGELDSSTLELDGDYAQSDGNPFPLTFPITFSGGTSTVVHDIYTG